MFILLYFHVLFVWAPTTEMNWVGCGPEFWSDNLRKVLTKVTRALYGMESLNRDFKKSLEGLYGSYVSFFFPC